MASTELDEETRRLIKLFRPAKDAETSWRIDVSAELAWYLDMLQQNDAAAIENVEDSSQLNRGLASVIAYEGINFSQASAVVMEATRVFSRKVDFLRKQMDSTLTTILTGAGQQSKKAKQKRQRTATLGSVNLPEWEIPDIPDSAEFMHLPLEKLTGFREYTEDNGKNILPLEKHLHILMPIKTEPKCSPPASPAQNIENIESEDEVMMTDAPKQSRRQSLAGNEVLTTCDSASTRVFPICNNLREIAIVKKQVFSRPVVHLLAPCQINPTLAGSSFHFELFNFFKTHATTRGMMGHSGLLSFLTYRHLFDSHPQAYNLSAARLSFSPRIGGGDCVGGESVHPSVMHSQMLSANFGGTTAPNARPLTPIVEPKKPASKNNQEPDFHDEHEAIGKDAPIRVGATSQKINVQLYTQSLEQICNQLIEMKKERDGADFLSSLFVALTGEYGIERLKFVESEKNRSTLPFFTDVKKSNPVGATYHYKWNLPPKERAHKSATTSGESPDAYDEAGGMGDDLGDYMADELDEARVMDLGGASVMHGSESVMLVDTFSRLDNRLSIMEQNQSHLRASAHGSVNILSQMHERIGVWRQRVEQWMTVAANEESFDIPTYVQRIRAVKQEHNKAVELAATAQDPEGNRSAPDAAAADLVENSVTFSEVCRGAKRHEVCRLFLTSLLLVNRYGLDIQQKDVNDFSINLDQLADEDPEL